MLLEPQGVDPSTVHWSRQQQEEEQQPTHRSYFDCCRDRSLHLLVFWILFENVMSLHRTKATFIGLLEGGRANEWVVTEKLGDTMKVKMATKAVKKPPRTRIGDRWSLLSSALSCRHDYFFFFFQLLLLLWLLLTWQEQSNSKHESMVVHLAWYFLMSNSGYICWSSAQELSSSSVDVTMWPSGRTITSSTSSSKPLLSS